MSRSRVEVLFDIDALFNDHCSKCKYNIIEKEVDRNCFHNCDIGKQLRNLGREYSGINFPEPLEIRGHKKIRERKKEVVKMLIDGVPKKDIVNNVGISLTTVNIYVRELKEEGLLLR